MQNKNIRVFRDAVGIITGGASGIGRALAEELAHRGGEVVLADRQIGLSQQVAANINASGGKAAAMELDVCDFSAFEQLVQETVNRTGRLDYLFNNAGIAIGGSAGQHSIEDWNQILDINLRGVINGVQAAYKTMLAQGFGHIINTASLAGIIPSPGQVSYATTKYAVVGLSTSLRAEAAPLGIRVSVFCPGFIRTPILDGGGKYGKILMELSPEQKQRMRELIEKAKPMAPSTFADKALDLVAKNKAIIILPSWWKVLWWTHRLSPSLGIRLTQRMFQGMQNKLGID